MGEAVHQEQEEVRGVLESGQGWGKGRDEEAGQESQGWGQGGASCSTEQGVRGSLTET